jgi:ElaB/YqjD/DUF883 family membrane-anchored ribosome-binding protein
VRSFPADQEAKEGKRVYDTIEQEAQMAPKKEYEMEPSGKSDGQAASEVAEQAEELIESIGQTMDSAAQAVQDTIRRTKRSARIAMKHASEGIQNSTDYLTEKGMGGVVEDVEALIRRYPFQAFLISSSVGFLLSRSWKR